MRPQPRWSAGRPHLWPDLARNRRRRCGGAGEAALPRARPADSLRVRPHAGRHDPIPVVLGLVQWGATHTPGTGAAMTHDGCGADVRAVVRCAAGHDVDECDVVITGAGRPADRLGPADCPWSEIGAGRGSSGTQGQDQVQESPKMTKDGPSTITECAACHRPLNPAVRAGSAESRRRRRPRAFRGRGPRLSWVRAHTRGDPGWRRGRVRLHRETQGMPARHR